MSNLDNIFLAYDVRGKVGTDLTTDVAYKIGRAFATWLPDQGTIAVGRDMRPDSTELANSLIEGLRAQGRDVLDIGQVTSDMIYFAVGSLRLAGGMMVTASHNPGEYNGIKFCREGAKPVGVDTGLLDVKSLVATNAFVDSEAPGSIEQSNITESWIQHVLSFIDSDELTPLRIAVDAGNGMAGAVFPELEPYVPFEVTEMYFEPDGTFPNHIANPLEPKNLVDLQEELKKGGYAAGLAFDGDGDRAVLLDENGEIITGTVMSALLAEYFLDKEPGATILLNAICGQAAHDVVSQKGGTAIRTKVGHSYIKAKMREHNALFAGEHSGHYYFRDNFCADSGLIAAVIALYVLSTSSKPLSELVHPYREAYVQITETNFEVSDKEAVIDRLREAFTGHDISDLDGITVTVGNGWFNVRPSNTEPLLRLNAEAKSQQELDDMIEKVASLIKN